MLVSHIKPKIAPQRPQEPVYYIIFEDYLQPKNISKKSKPLLNVDQKTHSNKKPALRLKLLEHPVLVAGRKSKWRVLKDKVKAISTKSTKINRRDVCCSENNAISKCASIWHNKTFRTSSGLKFFTTIRLPKFLSFLRARNDDGLCKRKSGFEIYCEMASIHGFINFVGSTTGQRAFWCFVLFVAIVMSIFILIMSHLMNVNSPTILYTESTQFPSWSIPFPAVAICNINRISKSKALALAEKFHTSSNLTVPQLIHLFRFALYTTELIEGSVEEYQQLAAILEQNNIKFEQLLEFLTPDCENKILSCKWKGSHERCSNLFKKVQTPQGVCCIFNGYATDKNNNNHYKRSSFKSNQHVEFTTSCGSQTGLSVLLDPDLQDYQVASRKTPGFAVFIRDAYDLTYSSTEHRIIIPRSVNRISITPQQTHSTDYIKSLGVASRRCYLGAERKLFYYRRYSQVNCLAECKSSYMYDKCRCAPANWPRKANWTVCGLRERECYWKYKDYVISDLKTIGGDYRRNPYAEQFICDCYPLCDFNAYSIYMNSANLNREFALTDKRYFKDINITNHILLHVFYSELYAERLRLDISENWLSFVGTFGGITGLYMGYSVVSGFELIFFVFVRPACNWLTKKQIRYRIKKRQKKAQLEAERKRKMEEEQERQERIEAFLRMRPYCPGY